MRRCLAITGVFPPFGGAGAVRQVKLFNHLRAHGWRVDVVAPRGRAGWFRDSELAAEAERLRVVRVGLPAAPTVVERLRAAAKDPTRGSEAAAVLSRASGWARALRDLVAVPDEKAAWALAAVVRARVLLAREHYDILFTSSLPYSSHLAGLALRRSGGPPWVVEHRDPWVGHRFRAQGSPWRRHVDEWLETVVTDAADALTVISPGIAEELTERHGPAVAGKLRVITNGYDAADFSNAAAVSTDRFEMLYVGTFDARLTPPDVFLEAMAHLLRENPELRERMVLRVLGGADLEASSRLRRWIAAHDGADLVRVEGFSGHRRATGAMGNAGALLLCLAPGASWVLTSKVFEYLASGRPILAALPAGDCRALLERCGGAAVVDATDAVGLAAAMRSALNERPKLMARDATAIEQYDYRTLAGRMAELFSEVA